MGEDEAKNLVIQEESSMDILEEKSVIQPSPEDKPVEAKALADFENVTDTPSIVKSSADSTDRYAVLARLETNKRMSIIKAWEESEKIKAANKAVKKMHAITAWENTKKAMVEAELKQIQENLEKKKAEYTEKMKNKIVIVHKEAEEKRAMLEAKRVEDILKAEERAAKYRENGLPPKKLLGLF